MKKSRVLSIRLPMEALQSCFDLSDLVGAPTTVAGTAIARSISLLTANLRASGKLPVYTSEELAKLTDRWAAKINPSSIPSLELSSTTDFVDEPPSVLDTQAFDPYTTVNKPPGFDTKLCGVTETLSSAFEEVDLEDEITRQVRELEMEDELDLLDKILIS